jgi:hypothetical protein
MALVYLSKADGIDVASDLNKWHLGKLQSQTYAHERFIFILFLHINFHREMPSIKFAFT